MLDLVGRWLLFVGGTIALLGAALWLFGRLAPGGRLLPGDIVIQRPGLTVYLPLGTSIALSALLSALLWLAVRLRR